VLYLRLSAHICGKLFFDHRKSVRPAFISGTLFPIPAMSRDDGDVGDPTPLSC
jgi:hypothetical protein